MYQKNLCQMVQGETHSSDSDVASEFYFLMLRYILIFFALIRPPPLFTDRGGEGHNNCLYLYIAYVYRIDTVT